MTTSVNGAIIILTGVVNCVCKEVNIIFSKFLSLQPEKQERIINAALKEFAQKGFENASTNEIVKEAEISKGILFHYFKNKKQLYLFLYNHCVDLCVNEFYSKINLDERDIIIRLRQTLLVKMELLEKFPDIIKFFQSALLEDSSDIKNEMEKRNDELIKTSYIKLFDNIDITKFKQGIDVKKTINIMTWTLEGFGNVEMEKLKRLRIPIDYEKAFAEVDIYLEMFKEWFYQ